MFSNSGYPIPYTVRVCVIKEAASSSPTTVRSQSTTACRAASSCVDRHLIESRARLEVALFRALALSRCAAAQGHCSIIRSATQQCCLPKLPTYPPTLPAIIPQHLLWCCLPRRTSVANILFLSPARNNFERAPPLDARLRRAGRHCHCWENQHPPTQQHTQPWSRPHPNRPWTARMPSTHARAAARYALPRSH